MQPTADSLRYILGLKVRRFRQEKKFGLKELAAKTGLSISYLSEIEKGRKYPKPDKILVLAQALGIPFDEMVSVKVDDDLGPITEIFASPFIQEFPFHLFGIEIGSVLSLVTEAPSKAGALVRTAIEIGNAYGMQVEHFLFAALRSYQNLHQNYFAEIEEAAAKFLHSEGGDGPPSAERLEEVLSQKHGLTVAYEEFADYPELKDLRSVWIAGKRAKILINSRLLPAQKAFQLGRELGYFCLGLSERSITSSPLKVGSFDQVINDFQAAYFSGALLLRRESILNDAEEWLANKRWNPETFLSLLERYQATPETFFYRLSQLLPHFFGWREMFFVRFNYEVDRRRLKLAKMLDMSHLGIPHGLGPEEHNCRRWPGPRLLRALGSRPASEFEALAERGDLIATAQRSTFLEADREFFVFTLARPLALASRTYSSVSLGFGLDRSFKRRTRFWNDPEIPQVEVNLTCERCSLLPDECSVRAAPPSGIDAETTLERREDQLQQLIADRR